MGPPQRLVSRAGRSCPLTPESFWRLIDDARAAACGDPRRHVQTLEDALAELEPEDIVDFDRDFQAITNRAYGWWLWGAAHLIGGGCGDEGFADFRGWLISKGREVFERALQEPDSLADVMSDADGNGQLRGFGDAAKKAYQRRTGQALGRNTVRMPRRARGEPFDPAALAHRYPKLAARFDPGAARVPGRAE